jgi:hypothetical protein
MASTTSNAATSTSSTARRNAPSAVIKTVPRPGGRSPPHTITVHPLPRKPRIRFTKPRARLGSEAANAAKELFRRRQRHTRRSLKAAGGFAKRVEKELRRKRSGKYGSPLKKNWMAMGEEKGLAWTGWKMQGIQDEQRSGLKRWTTAGSLAGEAQPD